MRSQDDRLVTVDNILAALLGAAVAFVLTTLYWRRVNPPADEQGSPRAEHSETEDRHERSESEEVAAVERRRNRDEDSRSTEAVKEAADDMKTRLEESSGRSSGGGDGERRPRRPSRNSVKTTISRHTADIRNCGIEADDPPEEDTVFMTFDIQPSGETDAVSIETDVYRGTDIGECVADVVRSMTFPPSREGTTVKYPFYPVP